MKPLAIDESSLEFNEDGRAPVYSHVVFLSNNGGVISFSVEKDKSGKYFLDSGGFYGGDHPDYDRVKEHKREIICKLKGQEYKRAQRNLFEFEVKEEIKPIATIQEAQQICNEAFDKLEVNLSGGFAYHQLMDRLFLTFSDYDVIGRHNPKRFFYHYTFGAKSIDTDYYKYSLEVPDYPANVQEVQEQLWKMHFDVEAGMISGYIFEDNVEYLADKKEMKKRVKSLMVSKPRLVPKKDAKPLSKKERDRDWVIYELSMYNIDIRKLLQNDPDFSEQDIVDIETEVLATRKRSEDYFARAERLREINKQKK